MTTSTTCTKCNGTGQITAYGHVQNGVCFQCAGSGQVKVRKATKPSAKSVQKEQERLAKAADFSRKTELAKGLYADKITVAVSNPYYHVHAIEMAQRDGVWATL